MKMELSFAGWPEDGPVKYGNEKFSGTTLYKKDNGVE